MKQIKLLALVILLGFSVGTAQAATVIDSEKTATLDKQAVGDAFVVGNEAFVEAPVAGELFAFGGTVSVNNKPERSLWSAGNQVTANGAGYNAYIAGSTVILKGEYAHDVYVAGSKVTIEEGTVIRGELKIAASEVVINKATIGGFSSIAGGTITIKDTSFADELKLYVNTVNFSGAIVERDLTVKYSLDGLDVTGVQVNGQTKKEKTENPQKQQFDFGYQNRVSDNVFWLIAMLLVGWLLITSAKKLVTKSASSVTGIGYSLNWITGFAYMILMPIGIIITLCTLLGWRVAVVLGALYALVMSVTAVSALVLAGSWFNEKVLKRPALTTAQDFLMGCALIFILNLIPFVSFWAGLIFCIAAYIPTIGATLKVWKSEFVK